ncbi:gem-associated 2-like protein [Labeo rohita]|uniref:Gem-associated 2-like protein n=1 Tax=Labeo rohita TaxID=84645 RepID=A0A498N3J3_LABRO|nr:gem-associated 2-like protein [Labeo rohita]
MEDEDGWKRFCLGENVCLDIQLKEDDKVNPGLDYVKTGFPPFLSIVSKLNQSTISAVLEYLINWFEERDFVPQLESKDDDRLSALNLMICIVARYFEQNDLADKE